MINRNLEALAKQLYDYWFVQFDFPDENGRPYKSSGGKMVWNDKLKREIPQSWGVIQLSDGIRLEDSRRIPLSKKEREGKKPGYYPYYGATEIMDYINDYIFDGDYILLAEDGSTSDNDGSVVIQYIWGKTWVNNHAHIVSPLKQNHLTYWYHLLKSIPAKAIETGSIQKKISQENLLPYKIVEADNLIISKFSIICNPIWTQRKILVEETNRLTKLRDELLPLLMNGQVSINSDLPILQRSHRPLRTPYLVPPPHFPHAQPCTTQPYCASCYASKPSSPSSIQSSMPLRVRAV